MRQTACDVCKKTHPDVEPVGWILVGFVKPTQEVSSTFVSALMGEKAKAHVLETFTLCSADCLRTFAELEGVKPD